MDIYRKVAERVRSYRARLGLTQEQLSERAGVNPVYIGQIERGERKPSLATLAGLARGLGLRTCDLLDEPVPTRPAPWAARWEALLKDSPEADRDFLYSTVKAMAKGLASKKR